MAKKEMIMLLIGLIFLVLLTTSCTIGSTARAQKEAELNEKMKEVFEREGMEIVPLDGPEEPVPEPIEEPEIQENPEANQTGQAFAVNGDLKDILEFGQKMEFIIGTDNPSKDVTTVINLKALFIPQFVAAGDAILDKEMKDIGVKNYFVVGSPCGNTVAAKPFAEKITAKGDCHSFPEGEAWIALIPTSKEKFAVYLGGDNSTETEKAAMVLGNFNYYAVHGELIRVNGNGASLTGNFGPENSE